MKCVPALLLVLTIGGCAASQCDPNTAGFFTGVGCAVGGGYATRRQDLANQLIQLQQSAATAESQAHASQAAAQALEATLQSEHSELAAMERDQAELAQRLAAAEAQHTATNGQIDAAKRALAALQSETNSQAGESAPDPAAVAKLKANQQQLLDLMAHM